MFIAPVAKYDSSQKAPEVFLAHAINIWLLLSESHRINSMKRQRLPPVSRPTHGCLTFLGLTPKALRFCLLSHQGAEYKFNCALKW